MSDKCLLCTREERAVLDAIALVATDDLRDMVNDRAMAWEAAAAELACREAFEKATP